MSQNPRHTRRRSFGPRARIAAVVAVAAVALIGVQSLTADASSYPNLRSIVKKHADGSLLKLKYGTYVFSNFDANLIGTDLHHDGIKGAGVHKTTIEMTPGTSTKVSAVPTNTGLTNQLYLLSTLGGTPGLSGFRLKATNQGHLYNGLRIGQATNARVHDVTIQNVPGDSSEPPGETFMLNDYRTVGSVYKNLRIEGGGVAAAGFATNSSSDVTVSDTYVTGTAASSGFTLWHTNGVTLNDDHITGNRSGINFEQSTGYLTLNKPVFKNNRLYDLQIGTTSAWPSAQVTINDPVLAAGQKIVLNVPAMYHGAPNAQLRSDIHVYVHGVDRTAELVRYL